MVDKEDELKKYINIILLGVAILTFVAIFSVDYKLAFLIGSLIGSIILVSAIIIFSTYKVTKKLDEIKEIIRR